MFGLFKRKMTPQRIRKHLVRLLSAIPDRELEKVGLCRELILKKISIPSNTCKSVDDYTHMLLKNGFFEEEFIVILSLLAKQERS